MFKPSAPSILYLALSGVRVHEEKLRALGMSLPGFIERGQTIAQLPSLGLLTLAGLTPPDWHVDYKELDSYSTADINSIITSGYDVVAISALTARIYDAYDIADQLRQAGITIILGGLHVSSVPDEAALHADSIVVGEGEPVWPIVLRDYATGNLKPRYTSTGQYSLSESPLPRYDFLNPKHYNRITLQTTRGCPLDCEFCGASRLISQYKRKPLDLVRRDLESILSIWPRPFIELADDNTFCHQSWSRDLVRLLARYPIRWFTETDISVADNLELLDMLAESGCAQLLIGLESSSAESLRGVDTRDWKLRRRDQYLSSIDRIQSRGISVNGCFTIGLDGDDAAVFESTRNFVMESRLSEVQVTVLTPFPGTALYHRLQREGRLLRPAPWESCTLFDVVYQPAKMSVAELQQGFAWLMKELYNPEATQHRKQLFSQIVRRRYADETAGGGVISE